MSLIGALKAAKKTAPFYSAVDEALAAIKRPKGTGAEFYTELTKQPGVKKAELADRKLEQAFKAKGKITKEEAQQVLADNPPAKIKEKLLEDSPESKNPTKFGKWKTAGGENYREMLLKLPKSDTSDVDKNYWSTHYLQDPNVLAHMRVQDRTGPNGEKILHVEEIQSDWHQTGRKKGYKPDDYIEQSNALDKEFSDLGKQRAALFQEAERIGYRGEGFHDLIEQANSITPKLMQLQEQRDNLQNVINYGVPDAPFKKNWHELAMKRLLNYAADNGYDSIAITPGAEQAKRYDLSKQLSRVDWDEDSKVFYGYDSHGRKAITKGQIEAKDLPRLVGKEVADRLIQADRVPQFRGDTQGPRILSGFDLQVGGEGMKGFYDKMLPDYLNNFGKPYGAQVGKLPIAHGNKAPSYGLPSMAEFQQNRLPEETMMQYIERMKGEPNIMEAHNFPITPEMRQQIQQKGLPLYQQIGIPTASAGAASQVPEQEEPQYGTGGAIAKMAKKAIPVVRAPEIIKPSGLSELKKIVEQEKGGYGARRLERAADEIPNLENLYKEQALKEVFTGDNARALMTMNPADFEEYAARLSPRNVSVPGFVGDKQRQSTEDYVKYLTNLDRFDDVPFLLINKEEQGLPLMPFISGHEGRHRNRSLVKRGEQTGLVQLLPRAELREPFPRRSQQEYIEALKEEMEMTGNKVKPESYFDDSLPKNLFIERSPIKLPDIYAKGGSVKPQVKKADGGAINYNTAPDMSDGGRIIQGAPFKRGGKVNMTANRDTMFMELSNKKLKRK